MNYKEKYEAVKAELERRMYDDYNDGEDEEDIVAQGICASMIMFMDSLPDESTSEDLEKASREYADNHYANYFDSEEGEENYWCSYFSFKAGANYYKQQMLKNSVSRVVHIGEDSYPFLQRYELAYDIKTQIPDINEGDKVKLIIIKED